MIEPFLGTWKLESSENFEEYLEQLGVAPTLRHLAGLEKPTISIRGSEAHLSIKIQSSFKTTEISFELGKEFDETTADNRKVKSIVTLDGGSLVHVQKWLGKETTIERQVVHGKMIAKYSMNNVVSTRTYGKV